MAKDLVTLGTSVDDGRAVTADVNILVDSRMLVQGNSRSGKSYLVRVFCERAAGHVPIIIIDIEGEYASLREKVDAVLVGSDGDIPTDLRSAELLARKLVELRVSAIIDIYDLKIQDRREYVRRFLDALMNLPKELWGPLIIVIDEAHKLCPEKGQGDSVATQPVIDLMSQGGKRQFCGVLITQRFSKLHNDAIAECNNVFIGRTWMDTDQIRAGKYLGMSPAERQALRELPQGEFYAFGPALSESGVIRFKGDKAETRVPKPGERHKVKPPKASDVIKQIVSQIDDLPEVAEQEKRDIASIQAAAQKREGELRTQISALQHELKNAAKPISVPKEIPGLSDRETSAARGSDRRLLQTVRNVHRYSAVPGGNDRATGRRTATGAPVGIEARRRTCDDPDGDTEPRRHSDAAQAADTKTGAFHTKKSGRRWRRNYAKTFIRRVKRYRTADHRHAC
jgi:hypothetical protein